MNNYSTSYPSEPSPLTNPGIRVLVVDDQPMVVEGIRRLLAEEQDITFQGLSDPGQAMDIVTRFRPTVILLDLVMPDIDGLQLTSYLRVNPASKEIPIVILSSRDEATTKAEAFSVGANDYLVKLPDQLELVARVRYHASAYIDHLQNQRLQEELSQAQKLESVGQLAAGIAHEINTPTQYANNNIDFLQSAFADLLKVLSAHQPLLEIARAESLAPDLIQQIDQEVQNADLEYLREEVPCAIEQALEGLQKIAGIVGAMKEFSHSAGSEMESVDLNRLIENTLTVTGNEWRQVATAETDLAADLPTVLGYRDQLGQVFLNLIINAVHAIGDVVGDDVDAKGIIRITTHRKSSQVEVRISDTGTGIPDSVRDRIFDPFFTTKEVGTGTGQGLSIVWSVVVDKHGGTIEALSEQGKGAQFVINLPMG